MIVRVNAVLNRTVIDVSTTCAVVIFTVEVSCITSVDGIKLWSGDSIKRWFVVLVTRTHIILALPPKRIPFRLQVHERVGVSIIEVCESVGKSVISLCTRGIL